MIFFDNLNSLAVMSLWGSRGGENECSKGSIRAISSVWQW
jgi:hypothetical protein